MSKKDGEDDLLKVRSSRKVYIPVYLMIFILLFTIGAIKYMGRELNSFAFRITLIFSVLCMLMTESHRFRNLYEINNSSLIHTKGILFQSTKRTDLLSVSDAEIKQNPWQRMLNYGTVEAAVFSKDSMTVMHDIDKPMEFVVFLEGKMANKRGAGGQQRGGRK